MGLLSLSWVIRSYSREKDFLAQNDKSNRTHVAKSALKILAAENPKAIKITFVASKKACDAQIGDSILEIAEENKEKIESGCRMGMCGADPVNIKSGWEQLSEISADEQATLDRLGHGNTTRMACCAKLEKEGAVDVSFELDSADDTETAVSVADFAVDSTVKKIVIVGNGIAGVTAAEHVLRNSADCEIIIIGREPHNFYNRMGIARLLYGRSAMKGLYLIDENWYEKKSIQPYLNTQVKSIDRENKTLQLGLSESIQYDRLILACGGEAFVPEVPGSDLSGVYVLRTADDAMGLRAYSQDNNCSHAVIAGGGLLGLEAAYALGEMGLKVTVLERGQWLMRRQLDRRAGEFLRILLSQLGIDIMTNAEVARFHGEKQLDKVELKDGCIIEAQLTLVAAGVVPNTDLAKSCGLEVQRGIIVNDRLQSSDESIYVVGDAAEHRGRVYGLWTTAADQGKIVADNVLGAQRDYSGSIPSTMLKIVGVDVFSMGDFETTEGDMQFFEEDVEQRRYCKLVVREQHLVGVVMIGKISYGDKLKKLMAAKADLSSVIERLKAGELSAVTDCE